MPLRAFVAKLSFSFFLSEESGCGKSGKERKDKEVLLDYFQRQNLVTEKAGALPAGSSLAECIGHPAPAPAMLHTAAQLQGASHRPLSECGWWIYVDLHPTSLLSFPKRSLQLSTKQRLSEDNWSKREERNQFPCGGDPHLDDDEVLSEQLIWINHLIFRDPQESTEYKGPGQFGKPYGKISEISKED